MLLRNGHMTWCTINKSVLPRNTGTEMYAGRVVCCPMVSHVDAVSVISVEVMSVIYS